MPQQGGGGKKAAPGKRRVLGETIAQQSEGGRVKRFAGLGG
jgi:hypothetical protein